VLTAVIARSASDEAIQTDFAVLWIALLRFARNDVVALYHSPAGYGFRRSPGR
jgi:hypothetical protein